MGTLRQVDGSALAAAHLPDVLTLADPAATDPSVAGAKAANLARATRAGLPVLPGVVLTTRATAGPLGQERERALRAAVSALCDDPRRPLVVRSSSTVEDAGTSSMAGQFRSVLGVAGWPALLDAVAAVTASAHQAGGPAGQPMAVLVQPQLDADCGGVLFGADPVSGRRDRIVVEAVSGGPEALVSGRASAQRWVLSRSGRVREIDGRPPHAARRARVRPLLGRRRLRSLTRLARRAEGVYGSPQDIEWAWDRAGRLWLLQSRPVTALGPAPAEHGPVLGPGPVAETFPAPLRPLEAELWLDPLREGVLTALGWTGVADHGRLRSSPVTLVVAGWAAADLELFGYVPVRRAGWRLVDPRPGARRLRAAWRVGRLRAQLPARVDALLTDVDARLAAIPPLETVGDPGLIDLLGATRTELAELHAHEVAAATLHEPGQGSLAAVALHELVAARATGLDDAAAVCRSPILLALVPPRLGAAHPLPPVAGTGGPRRRGGAPGRREFLRLRARWDQELTARIVDELGRRLVAAHRLPEADLVAFLSVDELIGSVRGDPVPSDVGCRAARWAPGPRLPAQFRLAPDGTLLQAARPGARPAGGTGAGGGRGEGPVAEAPPGGGPRPGSVLVVRTLDPALAGLLPGLAGLVAETGSTLSHLAILAREFHVPTVVGVHDAVHRFPPGTRLLVDGRTGEVSRTSALQPSGTPGEEGGSS